MLSEVWRTLARKYIVYDVPDEMAACFDCDAVQCPNEKYETCPNRLAHAAALKAARAADEAQKRGADSSHAGQQDLAVAERPHEQQKDRLLMLGLPKRTGCD